MNYSKIYLFFVLGASIFLSSCSSDDDNGGGTPDLTIPNSYVSANFNTNAATELTVISELATMTGAANDAEARAVEVHVNGNTQPEVAAIPHPATLKSVTIDSYETLIDGWLEEIVSAANSADGFVNPRDGIFPADQEGGALGTRLLDEYGLELEQMLQKGSFGAALYNHAINVVDDIKDGSETSSTAIDKLVAIYGATPAFDANSTAASQYAERRSNHDAETGFFYDIRSNLITAKAAMEAGSAYDSQRDTALDAFLSDWEKSNFATVIFYCRATINLLNEASTLEQSNERATVEGNAMHAYAEGVAFAHGFKGAAVKDITDAEIDTILENLLAPESQNPESYKFLNDDSFQSNLEDIITDIQAIYGFTAAEVNSFYQNNNL